MRVAPANIYFPAEERSWILAAIDECLTTGRLTLGAWGEKLEEEFAAMCGARHAVAVNSGTSALEIILRAVGIEGREVIVPSDTFYATAGAVVHAGGRPRFADCDPATFALDPASLEASITPNTAAVIIVHIGGLISPDIGRIQAICDAHGMPLIEDAAHAQGSSLDSRRAGSFGLAAAFSFYPTKVMTSGEGGIIVTDDESIFREARIYRDQGKEGFTTNFHIRLGYNWRLSEPHAILGLSQLRCLPDFIERRNAIARTYDEALDREGGLLKRLIVPEGAVSNYYKYVVVTDGIDRTALKQQMRERFDVGLSGEVYDTPCHRQPVFAAFAAGALPQADSIAANHICLPVSAVLTAEDARYVVTSLHQALAAATVGATASAGGR
jgi:perosamine synthetase